MTQVADARSAAGAPERGARRLPPLQGRVVPLLVLTALGWVVFSVAGQGFLTAFTTYALTQAVAVALLVGLAQGALLVLGRINLAVGGVGVLASSVLGVLGGTSLPLPVLLLLVVLVGVTASLLMGLVEVLTGLNSFVVTLAFLSLYQGGVLLVTQAAHYPISSPALLGLGNGFFLTAWTSPALGVALVAAVLVWLVYARTTVGWRSRATGANERATAASGTSVRAVVLIGYGVSGALASLAAVLVASQLADASPTTGADWLLLSFIGPLLGGVALSGGSIAVWGTLAGSLFYASIFSGFSVLSVPTYWLTFLQALVLLVALLAGQLRGLPTSLRPGPRPGVGRAPAA